MRNSITPQVVVLAAVLSLVPAIGTTGSKMDGTYIHPMGMMTLDLKPAGKATLMLMGESYSCSYKVSGGKLLLDCTPKGEKLDFVINGDGSLTGPGFVGSLKKSEAIAPTTSAESPEGGEKAAQTSDVERAEVERQAQEAVMAEVKKHWLKGPEGWITARNTGSSFAPIEFLRQFRTVTVAGVREYDLSESDRLNGLEWAGEVSFKAAPCREAGEPGILLDGLVGANRMRQRGRWSQWVEFQPESVRVQKVQGSWQVQQDTWLLRGRIPGAEDFAKAGVK